MKIFFRLTAPFIFFGLFALSVKHVSSAASCQTIVSVETNRQIAVGKDFFCNVKVSSGQPRNITCSLIQGSRVLNVCRYANGYGFIEWSGSTARFKCNTNCVDSLTCSSGQRFAGGDFLLAGYDFARADGGGECGPSTGVSLPVVIKSTETTDILPTPTPTTTYPSPVISTTPPSTNRNPTPTIDPIAYQGFLSPCTNMAWGDMQEKVKIGSITEEYLNRFLRACQAYCRGPGIQTCSWDPTREGKESVPDSSTLFQPKVCYSQRDYPEIPPPPPLNRCTIDEVGCGPVTVSNILTNYKGRQYTPEYVVAQYYPDFATNFDANGMCFGSKYSFAKEALILKARGFELTDNLFYQKRGNGKSTAQVANQFKQYINNGWQIFAWADLCCNKKGEAVGHFFWITDVNEKGEVYVVDSYNGWGKECPMKNNYLNPSYLSAFAFRDRELGSY